MTTTRHCSLVMSITQCRLTECEQVTKITETEVALDVILLIHHTAAQCLLVSLSLQHLLFYRTRL